MQVTWVSFPIPNVDEGQEKGEEGLSYRHIWMVQFIDTTYEWLYLWLSSQTCQKSLGCSTIMPGWSRLHQFIIRLCVAWFADMREHKSLPHPAGPLEKTLLWLAWPQQQSFPGRCITFLRLPFSWALPAPGPERPESSGKSLGWSAGEVQGIGEEQPLF